MTISVSDNLKEIGELIINQCEENNIDKIVGIHQRVYMMRIVYYNNNYILNKNETNKWKNLYRKNLSASIGKLSYAVIHTDLYTLDSILKNPTISFNGIDKTLEEILNDVFYDSLQKSWEDKSTCLKPCSSTCSFTDSVRTSNYRVDVW